MMDIAAEIWHRAVPGKYPETAEKRAAVDAVLREGIQAIESDAVRGHAVHLIRLVRADAMQGDPPPDREGIMSESIRDRIEGELIASPLGDTTLALSQRICGLFYDEHEAARNITTDKKVERAE